MSETKAQLRAALAEAIALVRRARPIVDAQFEEWGDDGLETTRLDIRQFLARIDRECS